MRIVCGWWGICVHTLLQPALVWLQWEKADPPEKCKRATSSWTYIHTNIHVHRHTLDQRGLSRMSHTYWTGSGGCVRGEVTRLSWGAVGNEQRRRSRGRNCWGRAYQQIQASSGKPNSLFNIMAVQKYSTTHPEIKLLSPFAHKPTMYLLFIRFYNFTCKTNL